MYKHSVLRLALAVYYFVSRGRGGNSEVAVKSEGVTVSR